MLENKQIQIVKHTEGTKIIGFQYTNYRGDSSWRTVEPVGIRFGSNEWHNTPQWLLRAFDIDRGAEREFAMKDISAWNPIEREV